uniref:Uncharacterized protein n=1 Tax=Arundo donax TaxID=35708 RepID=A0A0A9F1J7_ARUDO
MQNHHKRHTCNLSNVFDTKISHKFAVCSKSAISRSSPSAP